MMRGGAPVRSIDMATSRHYFPLVVLCTTLLHNGNRDPAF